MAYTKPWKSYEEQLDTLIARGMSVTDRAAALDYLERIGYYRLSGYWYPLRDFSAGKCSVLDPDGKKPSKPVAKFLALDHFKPGVTFQHAVRLYVFDKQLRMLALDALGCCCPQETGHQVFPEVALRYSRGDFIFKARCG